ncbi:DUF1624 domain-containing protein [Aquicoccus sp. G2-2]|uniref:DUF1624 domain-containing protein n=1 Tax=Aquicoccus sp. G2-2 TaxID=3092120 RepID=UPI002ADF8AB9|nr:heparan-alpha-glucosaminide N-acetyltransferase [Aquicoccus sp. G2-2]MEA1113314.1 heparan-alpha-glucosaminide N-acetyltransferase [Aquicoccus sp. G2-2]
MSQTGQTQAGETRAGQLQAGQTRAGRIHALDLARGLALIAMAVFHFSYDLEMFGQIAPGTIGSPAWRLFAECIAGSFLFVSGISLWLAHGRGVRVRAFVKRLGVIVAAALLVTLATFFAARGAFIFFGILHVMALASVVGVLVLRWPALVIALLAAGFWFAGPYLSAPMFDHPVWWWTGLSTVQPVTLDYEPVFPWLGPYLAGLAVAKFAARFDLWQRLRSTEPPGRSVRVLGWPGRHSLSFYLLHQPILISLLWLFLWVRGVFGG